MSSEELTHCPLRILLLEDNPQDAELIQQTLVTGGLVPTLTVVQTEADFIAAIEKDPFDLILADYQLPSFDGLSALAAARRHRPKTPFIIVSGALGEEVAIENLKRGATDYVLKQRLSRLVSAVRRALREVAEERESKQAEHLIHEQAALLDQVQDAIYVRDLRGSILYLNQGAERLYGWSKEEALQQNANHLLHREMSAQLKEAIGNTLAQGLWSGELAQVTKTGKDLTVQSRWKLIRNREGALVSILVTNTDVTDKKRVEAQFLRAQRLESVGRLASGIAHDLNNVLTPIMLGLSMLRKQVTRESGHHMLEMLVASAERGTKIIQQVLTFARGIEGQKIPIQPRYLVKEMAKIIQETFPKSITLHTQLPEDLWMVTGDATQLHQVLMNLCINARDAMREGGSLTLGAENIHLDEQFARMIPEARVGPYVLLWVVDTGMGIPPENLDRIFDPFFTTKESGTGTGLGLSTVLGIVKEHGGFIQVLSKVGQGSQFRVYLPATLSPAAESLAQEIPRWTQGQGERILVVDDEAIIRDIAQQTLQSNGYQVVTAGDGTEALSLYAQNQSQIQAILMDAVMPFLDGPSTLRALRKMNPQVKVIVMTGFCSDSKLDELPKFDAQAVLQKPFSAKKLLQTLHLVLRGKS